MHTGEGAFALMGENRPQRYNANAYCRGEGGNFLKLDAQSDADEHLLPVGAATIEGVVE